MNQKERKLQKTIRFERDVVRAAAERSRRIGLPYSVVLANAAKESLLSSTEDTIDAEIKQLRRDVLTRINAIEHNLGRELVTVRELLGLFLRCYLNHTPEIPTSERAPASISGQLRFSRLRDLLLRNVQDGASIFDDSESIDEH